MGLWGDISKIFEDVKKGVEGAVNVVIPSAPKVDPKKKSSDINPDKTPTTPTKTVINEDVLNKENKLLERFFKVDDPFYSKVDEDKKPIEILSDDEKKLMRKVVVEDIKYLEKEISTKGIVINIINSSLNSSERYFVNQFIDQNRHQGQPNEEQYNSNCYKKHYVEAVVKYHISLEAVNNKLNELGPLPEQKTQQPAPPPPTRQPPRAPAPAPAHNQFAGRVLPPARQGAGGNQRRAPIKLVPDPSIGGKPIIMPSSSRSPNPISNASQARQQVFVQGGFRPEGYQESKERHFEKFKKMGIDLANSEEEIKNTRELIDSLRIAKGNPSLGSHNPTKTKLLQGIVSKNELKINKITENLSLFGQFEKDMILKAYNTRKEELKLIPRTAPRTPKGVYPGYGIYGNVRS